MKLDHAFKAAALAFILSTTAGPALSNEMEASDFVEKVSQNNHAEMESAKIVVEQGKSAEVKSFAKRMMDEHAQENAKLSALAAKKKIEMEDEAGLMDDAKAMILKLRDEKDIDAAYLTQQVKAHEDAVKLFEEASLALDDADLKSYAQTALPALRDHLATARKLSGNMQ